MSFVIFDGALLISMTAPWSQKIGKLNYQPVKPKALRLRKPCDVTRNGNLTRTSQGALSGKISAFTGLGQVSECCKTASDEKCPASCVIINTAKSLCFVIC
jgi:hypothetical protein